MVAEGQSLGNPLAFGGPYLGIMACREEYVRKMPGRIVGQTTDRHGKRCWVLTLQTREQHIRREKATSNICTNQGLLALRASIYLAAMGPHGLRQAAELSTRKAHYAAEQLAAVPGLSLAFPGPFFKEFVVRLAKDPTDVLAEVGRLGYHGGIALGRWYPELADCILVAVTEKRTKAEIDGLADAYNEAMGETRRDDEHSADGWSYRMSITDALAHRGRIPGDGPMNLDCRQELIRGEVDHDVPSGWPAWEGCAARSAVWSAITSRTHGSASTYAAETGFIVERDPDTVRGADVGLRAGRTARRRSRNPEKYIPFAPDLAVEVLSPNDRADEVEEKVQLWLRAGSLLVWVVDPENRTVVVHRPRSRARDAHAKIRRSMAAT